MYVVFVVWIFWKGILVIWILWKDTLSFFFCGHFCKGNMTLNIVCKLL